ncbi:MAG TPA: SgcJ/EcaC family oxidoreductase [Gemmatimonadaceae bacterium]
MVRATRLVLLLLVVVVAWFKLRHAATPIAQVQDHAQIQRQVLAVLAHGAKAWNAGDLDGFVSDYLPDTETTFITKTGVLHGIAAIRGVYAARFALGAKRDSLHFEGVEIDVLGPDVVNTIAWYVLLHGDSVASRGPTSLVMRRVSGRWRIVHDHSS